MSNPPIIPTLTIIWDSRVYVFSIYEQIVETCILVRELEPKKMGIWLRRVEKT